MAEVYPKNAAEFRHMVTERLGRIEAQVCDIKDIRSKMVVLAAVQQQLEDLKTALVGNGQPGRLGIAEKDIESLSDRYATMSEKQQNQGGRVTMLTVFVSALILGIFKAWEYLSGVLK